MPLIELKRKNSKESAVALIKKSNDKPNKITPTVKGGGILTIVNNAKRIVDEKLGHLRDNYIVIRDLDTLEDYIQKSIENGVIAIDTETTGLDPIDDSIVGVCLYTPNMKACYVPINHISYITYERVSNQLTADEVGKVLSKLKDTKIIMFNATFDIRVLRNQCNCYLTCYWDCSLASRCMNENEPKKGKGLKALHSKYVLKGKQDEFSFGELFEGITFDLVPIDTAYIYAAHDAIDTMELYDFQKQYLYYDENEPKEARNGMNGVAWVFFNLEMPCVDVVATIEDTGVALDLDYANKLSTKYHALLDAKELEIKNELKKYDKLIADYKKAHSESKISSELNVSSPTQLAIFFYDILQVGVVDKDNPRGTGEDILKQIDLPISKLILDYRGLDKLIGTYIDKLPKCLSKKDNRIHCRFNQYGADTGRFSSNNPNLQNIPSHNTEIRKMFKATDGYVLMSADYSQQEPKCLAALCRLDGDSQMYDVFMQGKDLYVEIASKAFHESYLECVEHFPKDTPIKKNGDYWYYATDDDYDKLADGENDTYHDGKVRRTKAKSILLGVNYGRGTASIAEQLKCSVEEATNIKNSVFQGFPAIKIFEQKSIQMAIDKGYVTTICGRKRRLPSMQLPDYDVRYIEKRIDPLDFTSQEYTDEVDNGTFVLWQMQYMTAKREPKFKREQAIKKVLDNAKQEGIIIIDNTRNKDTTKVVNARIQGSAADLTKAAMIELSKNKRLKELGFRMLIQVHDEIIAECPEENAKEVKKLFADTMCSAAQHILDMPITCDVATSRVWYGESLDV